MTRDEIRKRQEEQFREADGWIALNKPFFEHKFEEIRCPHCQSADMGYALYANGFSIVCLACKRSSHGRGKPDWAGATVTEPGQWIPIHNFDHG